MLKTAKEAKAPDYLQPIGDDTKSLCIRLLAKYPTKSAIDFLLDNIQYGKSIIAWNAIELPFQGNEPFPAVVSLIEIGIPSVKAIIERLEQKDVFDRQKTEQRGLLPYIYGYVIQHVLELDPGIEYLMLEYKKAQRKGKEHKMKNIEIILREWFCHQSPKTEAFLKEIEKQRKQEKQKQQESEKSQ